MTENELELNHLVTLERKLEKALAERDALIAYTDSLRKVTISVSENRKPDTDNIHEMHKNFVTLSSLLTVNPQQHLAEIRAEAGKIGYYEGYKAGLQIECPPHAGTSTNSSVDYRRLVIEQAARESAERYATSIRKGGN